MKSDEAGARIAGQRDDGRSAANGCRRYAAGTHGDLVEEHAIRVFTDQITHNIIIAD
ncbi:hypothetical protein D3C71_2215610 [compost metagenome]